MTSPTPESWVERFDELYPQPKTYLRVDSFDDNEQGEFSLDGIKSFITSLLLQERTRIEGEAFQRGKDAAVEYVLDQTLQGKSCTCCQAFKTALEAARIIRV